MKWLAFAACCFVTHSAVASPRESVPPPARVVSLNPCIDAILVAIAPREQIAALSFRSREPTHSVITEIAKTYPITYETAEEVITLRPDVVLATKHSALATRNLLRRVGVRTIVFDVPESVDSSFVQIREVAAVIGHSAAGEALIARLQGSIAAARRDTPIDTLIFLPSGLTPGQDTLIGELMRIVGLENVASRYGVERWGLVGLEQLVAHPPELLLTGEVAPGAPTWAERMVQHPALRNMPNAMTRITFPARQLYCGGPVMEVALRSLVSARETTLRNRAQRLQARRAR